MLVQCWASVADGGPALNQHWVNVLCMPGLITQAAVTAYLRSQQLLLFVFGLQNGV